MTGVFEKLLPTDQLFQTLLHFLVPGMQFLHNGNEFALFTSDIKHSGGNEIYKSKASCLAPISLGVLLSSAETSMKTTI